MGKENPKEWYTLPLQDEVTLSYDVIVIEVTEHNGERTERAVCRRDINFGMARDLLIHSLHLTEEAICRRQKLVERALHYQAPEATVAEIRQGLKEARERKQALHSELVRMAALLEEAVPIQAEQAKSLELPE